jgi:hypothetical protein
MMQTKEMYRACGITLTSLRPESVISNDLFGSSEKSFKRAVVYETVDKLQAKYGRDLVHSAGSLYARKRTRNVSESPQTERNLLFMS